MGRPVTLFTGQWADMPFETLCEKAAGFGYDGLELACWGDHFDVDKAATSKTYCKERWAILKDHGLTCYSISHHLMGQLVCDNIDSRHKDFATPDVWGDGKPEGVRKRAAKKMIKTSKAAANMGLQIVNGFTGSSIWQYLYSFPPASPEMIEAGFQDFAKRWIPILDGFKKNGVRFALEVHPTEIAFDIASAERALKAVKNHSAFGFNYDPSHFGYQGVDYVKFIRTFPKRIFHVHIKDAWWGHGDGTVGVFGGHTEFADPRRYWDFRSPGHGDIAFEDIMVALNDIGYAGPLSVEWEDSRMDREHGAAESAEFVRAIDFPSSNIAFDAQFDR
jgi:sugar phosphate isomerase/epimerase